MQEYPWPLIPTRRIIFPIILLVFGTAIALSIAEITLRALKIGYGNSPLESHPIFHHVHPAEYRFLSNVPTSEYGGHVIYYNAGRLVANPSAVHAINTNPTCRVAFLGDSFTEAVEVAYTDSFVGILERNSNCTLRNYGTSSYSPIFYLLQWREVVKEFNPTLVIIQLFSNDVTDDEIYMGIAKKNKNGDVIAIPGPDGFWIVSQLRKTYLARFIRKVKQQLLWMYENRSNKKNIVAGMAEENSDITKLSADLIKTLAREVEASGAQFVLTVVPSKYRIINNIIGNQTPQFSDKWRLFSQNNNIPFIDLTNPFEKETEKGVQLFFDDDIHFNENGHKVVASELSKHYPGIFTADELNL